VKRLGCTTSLPSSSSHTSSVPGTMPNRRRTSAGMERVPIRRSVDDRGYLSYDDHVADLLFQIVSGGNGKH
jgi:hypothetical protein